MLCRTFTLLFIYVVFLSGCQPGGHPANLTQHTSGGAVEATISKSGKYAVSSTLNHGVVFWDLKQNALLYNWYQTPSEQSFSLFEDDGQPVSADTNFVLATAISANDSHVLTADKHTFSLWDVKTGNNLGYWQVKQAKVQYINQQNTDYEILSPHHCNRQQLNSQQDCVFTAHIRAIAVSNFANRIVLGKSNGEVVVINRSNGHRLEFLGHQQVVTTAGGEESFHINNAINSVAISPNGKYVLSGSSDKSAYLWDTQTGQVIYKFQHANRVNKVSLDPKGRFAFTSDGKKQANIWDLKTGQQISNLRYIHRQEIFTTANFSDNGKWLVTGSPARKLAMWDVKTGQKVQDWTVAENPNSAFGSATIYSAAFSNNDTQILTLSSAGFFEVWENKHGQ